jgi:hypothetical protein
MGSAICGIAVFGESDARRYVAMFMAMGDIVSG